MPERPDAVSLTVTPPDPASSARARARGRKPMASVRIGFEGGAGAEIAVPARVGRMLEREGIPLPCDGDAAFDAVHALEGRVCLSLLTEMLARRDHGTEEARAKLAAYGFRSEEIESTLERARRARFLDDDRFVRTFVDERKRRGWGRRKIELELRRRGIDLSEDPGYPDAFFSDEDDLARARELLSRRSVPADRAVERLTRHLMGKGFPYPVASAAARERAAEER